VGFNACFGRNEEFEFSASAHEYRQRFLIVALRAMKQMMG